MSKHVIHDIGTKILFETCLATEIIISFYESMIPVRFCTDFCVDSESAIKARFKTLFNKLPSWIRCYRFYNFAILSAQKAPAGRLSVIPKGNIRHWDRHFNFPLFCHKNNKVVL